MAARQVIPSSMNKLVALLSYFDEDPDWLYKSVESLSKLPVTDLVVLDGPYLHYPSKDDTSPESNYEAIEQACKDINLPLHYYAEGRMSEVDKRSRMFEIAEEMTTEDDWYMVLDADERVEHIDGEFTLQGDACSVSLYEPDTLKTFDIRIFFRAIRGLRVHHNHHTYASLEANKVLWGMKSDNEEPVADSRVIMSHHTNLRSPGREKAAKEYYDYRDSNGLEKFKCYFCKGWSKSKRIGYGWKLSPDGQGATCGWYGCCDKCFPAAVKKSEAQFEEVTGNRVSLNFV